MKAAKAWRRSWRKRKLSVLSALAPAALLHINWRSAAWLKAASHSASSLWRKLESASAQSAGSGAGCVSSTWRCSNIVASALAALAAINKAKAFAGVWLQLSFEAAAIINTKSKAAAAESAKAWRWLAKPGVAVRSGGGAKKRLKRKRRKPAYISSEMAAVSLAAAAGAAKWRIKREANPYQ